MRSSTVGERIDWVKRTTLADATACYRELIGATGADFVAVGDFDPARIEALIRENFSNLKNVPQPAVRTLAPVPGRSDPVVSIASDPEATNTTVSVYLVTPRHETGTVAAWRSDLVEQLASGILNERLWELTQKPNPPFINAGVGRSSLVRSADAFSFGALVSDTGTARGFEAILTELERAGRHGFTQSELDRARTNYVRGVEQAWAERDKTESDVFTGEYVSHFLTGEGIPGIEYEYAQAQAVLPKVQVAELNALAKEWLTGGAPVILVNTPEKNRAAIPTAQALLGLFQQVKKTAIAAYVENVAAGDLIPSLPAAGRIVSERRDSSLGTREWTLSNGAKVILKSTDFKADELLFQATASGGLSLAPDSLLTSARFAAQVVEVSGVGQYSAVDLQKKLAGKAIGISPYIGSYEHGLSGQASPRDAETLFQLAYLYFTGPRIDTGAVSAFLGNLRSALVNRSASPEAAFQDTLSVTLSQHHFWTRPFSSTMVGEVDPARALDFYRQRFNGATGFTFAIVGTFDPDSIRPLVERYIASIPGGPTTTSRDPGMRPPTTVVERTVRKGLDPKSQTALVFTGPAQVSLRERWILSALGEVLQIRLREELREELSGTYSVSVGPSLSRIPREQYSVSIRFGSDPKLADSLVRTIFSEIDSIQRQGPKATDLAKVKETFIRSRETALKENGWWMSQLMQAARDGDPAAQALEPLLAAVTVESVRDAAKKYLDRSRYVRVTLTPQ